MRTGRLLGIALVGIGLLVWSGPATAHDHDYESRLTIEKNRLPPPPGGGHKRVYKGELFSGRRGCIVGRKVKLVRANGLNMFETTIHSEDEGRYRFVITFEGQVPEVHTKVKRVDAPGPHEHICLPDRTRDV